VEKITSFIIVDDHKGGQKGQVLSVSLSLAKSSAPRSAMAVHSSDILTDCHGTAHRQLLSQPAVARLGPGFEQGGRRYFPRGRFPISSRIAGTLAQRRQTAVQ
jgi:hypothetical protein